LPHISDKFFALFRGSADYGNRLCKGPGLFNGHYPANNTDTIRPIRSSLGTGWHCPDALCRLSVSGFAGLGYGQNFSLESMPSLAWTREALREGRRTTHCQSCFFALISAR